MAHPPYRLRDETSGVSEVVGTLLILAMTVVLFASIIIWVSNIPTPPATTKLDMDASYVPILLSGNGANVTLRHRGGEDMFPTDVRIYVRVERTGIPPTTTVLKTKGVYTSGPLNGKAYGLVDGSDAVWNIGERWQWSNYSTLPTDTITATVVDLARNIVLWSGQILGAPGSHPPIFLDKWADREWTTPTVDTVYTAAPFHILARMSDQDNDLVSVKGTLTIYFGTPDSCKDPQTMYDDGTNGDLVAGDGVWTLYRTCMDSPSLTWDGTIVLFNATDAKGHYTNSRMTLRVTANPSGAIGGGGPGQAGRPPNLRYNGLQGYNIFNSTDWAVNEFVATPVRSFRANEQVVVVVGSKLLVDTLGRNQFTLYDPYSGIPADPVVYGATKTVSATTRPTNSQAFSFYKFSNGYNVFTYKFDMNNVSSVGTNFYTNPQHPPYYFFGQYDLAVSLVDSTGLQFVVADSFNITDLSGNKRPFPVLTLFKDSVYTLKGSQFRSTDVVYVQVNMLTVDSSNANVQLGNIILRDLAARTQILRAPINGHDVNQPLCPITGSCSSGNIITVVDGTTLVYRFAINLTLANQDPWIEGPQSYSLTISSLRDADEQYANLAINLFVVAPLYRLDLLIGNADATSSAWGTHDFSYTYAALNGVDRWQKNRLMSGNFGSTYTKALKFLDFDRDGKLDIAASLVNWPANNNYAVLLFRQDIDAFGNPVFTQYQISPLTATVVNDIAVGDVTADGLPEIVAAGADGKVWYYRNDGAWTKIDVDTTSTAAVNALEVGDFNGDGANDIAVGRATTTNQITYYLNLDGQGRFANIAATDDWFPETDATAIGLITAGSYLDTYVSDNVRESIREVTVNEAQVSGATINPDFTSNANNWTYVDWENPSSVTGLYQSSGGNPGGYVDVRMTDVSGAYVSGFWYQSFVVSGAGPWTATINLNYRLLQIGTRFSSETLYAFVDRTTATPTLGQQVWSQTLTATGSWTSVSNIAADARITGPGTYYLKIVARTLNNAGTPGATPTIGGFDNVALSWSSTAGPVSEVKHYWRIQQLPNRPSSTYALFVEGQRSSSTDGDTTFPVGYAVGAAGAPPSDGAFVDVINVTATSDVAYSATLPTTLGGATVWIRVQDTDRTTGNVANDTVSVDKMYIHVVTPGGATGANLQMPDNLAVTAIDAGDQQPDGYLDLVVGTAGGHIYRLLGSSGGLLPPSGAWYTVAGASFTGVKWMNGTATYAGLEIGLSYGTTVLVITGSGGSGTLITTIASAVPSGTITAFGAGDVDGDGDDDVMAGSSNGAVRYWRNPQLASWAGYAYVIDDIGVQVYDLDLGDMSNSAYVGR